MRTATHDELLGEGRFVLADAMLPRHEALHERCKPMTATEILARQDEAFAQAAAQFRGKVAQGLADKLLEQLQITPQPAVAQMSRAEMAQRLYRPIEVVPKKPVNTLPRVPAGVAMLDGLDRHTERKFNEAQALTASEVFQLEQQAMRDRKDCGNCSCTVRGGCERR